MSCVCAVKRGVYDRRIDMKRVWCTEGARKESVLWFDVYFELYAVLIKCSVNS